MVELVQFGNHLLTNSRFLVDRSDNKTLSPFEIQSIPRARAAGSSVVFSRPSQKLIKFTGSVLGNTLHEFRDNKLAFDKIFDLDTHYLRYIPDYLEVFVPTTTTNWSAADDAASIGINTDNYQYGNTGQDTYQGGKSLSFNVDVSADADNQASVSNVSLTPKDLTSVALTGNFEIAVYIPDTYYITSIDVRVGTDASNYYYANLTTNYEGNPLTNGWNWLSIPWNSNTSKTGTPTDSNIHYLFVQLNYGASQGDMTGVLVDSLLWVNEDLVRNYPCYKQDVAFDSGPDDITSNSYSANFLNYTGYAKSTHAEELFSETGVTGVSDTQVVTIDGSMPALPLFNIHINTVTDIASFSIKNLNTGQQIDLSPTSLAAGDVISFGGENYQSLKNSLPMAFTNVIPTFKNGVNRLQLNIVGSSDTYVPAVAIVADSTRTNSNYPNNESNQRYIAQSFTASATSTITQFTFEAYTTGFNMGMNPYEAVSWKIVNDNAGSPGSTILASGSVNVPNANGTVTVSGLSVPITNTTKYWLVLSSYRKGSTGTWMVLYWKYKNDNSAYTGGECKTTTDAGANWSAATGDQVFRITQSPSPSWNVDWSLTYNRLYLA